MELNSGHPVELIDKEFTVSLFTNNYYLKASLGYTKMTKYFMFTKDLPPI